MSKYETKNKRSYQMTNHADGTVGVQYYQGTDYCGRFLDHHYKHYNKGEYDQLLVDTKEWMGSELPE